MHASILKCEEKEETMRDYQFLLKTGDGEQQKQSAKQQMHSDSKMMVEVLQ